MDDTTLQQKKQALIQQLDDAREQMRAVLYRVGLNLEIYPTWTIKHILAHLSGWDEACIATIEAFLNGDQFATPAARGVDFYNAHSVETRQELDFDHIRREYEFTRTQYKTLLERLPAEKIDEVVVLPWGERAPIARLITAFADHEAGHAVEIAEIVNKVDAEKAASAPVQDNSATIEAKEENTSETH